MKAQSLPWALLALVQVITAADVALPYTPTRILSTQNSTYAYVFRGTSNQGALQVLNLRKRFVSDGKLSPAYEREDLPFLSSNVLMPYLPTIDASGNLTVIAGSCAAGAQDTKVWRYALDAGTSGQGRWEQHDISADQLKTSATLTGVNYLGNGLAFSASLTDATEQNYYLFGGMCPLGNSTTATWQTAATYSNNMLAYTLSDASGEDNAIYQVSSIATRAPPVAEAGFTITGLTPTFRTNADGQPETQQQDFLLLGGHTKEAFLNTSQVALFSLPQSSWTFLNVQQPSTGRTDLAARQVDPTTIEPRSGHTAVLSDDGTSIIVLGGWVGDVSTPAQPQLAILHLGSEYGGNQAEAWTWSIPDQSGSGLTPGSGIYGHGATMLPGGVMMVLGGYTIPGTSSRLRKRQSPATDQVLLYNTTSNTWVETYMNPGAPGAAEESTSKGPLTKTSQQAGLGVGLGLGVLVLVALIIFYFWYMRRLKRKREDREGAHMVHSSDSSFMAQDQPFLDSAHAHDRHNDPYAASRDSPQMSQAGSTGLFVDMPSPTRGLRKGLISKPYNYHPAPRYDDLRTNKGSGGIHPILEHQEEEDIEAYRAPGDPFRDPISDHDMDVPYDGYSAAEAKMRELQTVLESGTAAAEAHSPRRDPFADPHPNPLGSHPTSPASPSAIGTVRRVRSPVRRPLPLFATSNWQIVDPEDHDEAHHPSSGTSSGPSSNGRLSPTKTDDRTSSTLSERSIGSTTSITRTMSTRTGAILAAALARADAEGTPATTPLEPRTATMSTTRSTSGRKSPYDFQHANQKSNREGKRPDRRYEADEKHDSVDSFMTAHSRASFQALQTEGEALLGGRPRADQDDPYQRALAAHGLHKPGGKAESDVTLVPPRSKGWVGSIRRALTAMSSDRNFSLTSQHKPIAEHVEPRTSSSSPVRSRKGGHRISNPPRRAVSDGGALLKQKRGQKDWEGIGGIYNEDPEIDGDWGEPRRDSSEERDAENEWDVEGAVSKRDVQVMFSIPKSRLRVVNADVERASMRSASDGAVSRKESMVDLRRSDTLRSRSGGDLEARERDVAKFLMMTTPKLKEGDWGEDKKGV